MEAKENAQIVTGTIPIAELRQLYRRSAWKPIVQTCVIVGTYFAIGCIGLWLNRWEVWIPIWFCQGFILSGSLGAAHDCVHGTLYDSPRANRIAGAVWASLVLFNFSLYKYFHLEHHRYTSVEGDTEPWGTFPNLWFYIATLPTIAFSTAFWKMSWMATKGLYPDFVKTPSARRSVDRDNWIQLIWLLLIGVLTIISPLLMASLYWIPLIISLPMLFLTNLSEHYDCDWGQNQWNNTRTITSNPIFRYYFWNANYHAEHHVYPGIPSYNYPKVHQLIGYRFKYVEKSYVMFHLKLIWSLIVGTKALGELPEIQTNHRIDYTYVMVDEKKESLLSLEE
jgi:fatty acid desaturase